MGFLRPPNLSTKRLSQIRYFVLFHFCFTIIYEIVGTYFICKFYQQDIATYDTDEIWKREFYKATRNFFVFTAILTFLVVCIGAVGTYKNHRALLACFLVMHIMEWGFELIGLYTSGDLRVFIYKVICQLTKPSLFLCSLIYCWVMKEPNSELD